MSSSEGILNNGEPGECVRELTGKLRVALEDISSSLSTGVVTSSLFGVMGSDWSLSWLPVGEGRDCSEERAFAMAVACGSG